MHANAAAPDSFPSLSLVTLQETHLSAATGRRPPDVTLTLRRRFSTRSKSRPKNRTVFSLFTFRSNQSDSGFSSSGPRLSRTIGEKYKGPADKLLSFPPSFPPSIPPVLCECVYVWDEPDNVCCGHIVRLWLCTDVRLPIVWEERLFRLCK